MSVSKRHIRCFSSLNNHISHARRKQSTLTAADAAKQSALVPFDVVNRTTNAHTSTCPTVIERLPTSSILRNVLLGTFMTSPLLFKPGFAALKAIANSQSTVLNPDKNPILKAIIKPLVYDQFCAGRNKTEIMNTKDSITNMGYSGVILGYVKEIDIKKSIKGHVPSIAQTGTDSDILGWEKGNLETLHMIGEGDWLALKFTGAGPAVAGALLREEAPPKRFQEALDTICSAAKSKNCRLWVDAESQAVQTGIDDWTLDLMRKYNQLSGEALVYNTLQAYLKTSRQTLMNHLALAKSEGWTLGIKLVRGAYIGSDRREAIHDTKEDTDACYNSIVRDVINGTNLGFSSDEFPKMGLFLAGHNPTSVLSAWDLTQTRANEGKLNVVPEFGQLHGMGDVLGCQILEKMEGLSRKAGDRESAFMPRIYKYSTWGSIQDCLQYLIRRMVENQGGTDRMKDGLVVYWKELRRRLIPFSS